MYVVMCVCSAMHACMYAGTCLCMYAYMRVFIYVMQCTYAVYAMHVYMHVGYVRYVCMSYMYGWVWRSEVTYVFYLMYAMPCMFLCVQCHSASCVVMRHDVRPFGVCMCVV